MGTKHEPTGNACFDAACESAFAQAMRTRTAVSRRGFVSLALGAAAACALPTFLLGCASSSSAESELGPVYSSDEIQSTTLFLFDTVIQISAACSEELMAQVSDRLNYFEGKFSRTVEGSDVWNINHASGASVQVARETADCISQALEYAKESNGLFDITIGAVSSLWDFVNGVKPEDAAIAKAVAHVDYRTVSVEGTSITLADPEAMIDPNGSANSTIASIEAQDISVVTSGLYEREFEKDGQVYYHILDPKTGYPAKTDLESSSITCSSSTTADAYSTILFLMGHDAAMQFVEGDSRFECVLVNSEGVASKSEGSAFKLANS